MVKIIIFFFLSLNLFSQSVILETLDYEQSLEKAVDHIIEKSKGNRGLKVFGWDIDNNILALTGREGFVGQVPPGADQWFGWQAHLLKNEPTSPDLVAKNFDELVSIYDDLILISKTRMVSDKIPSIFAKLRKNGFKMFAITARSPSYEIKIATQRELERYGLQFDNSLFKESYFQGTASLETLKKDFGLSNGVVYMNGQHKGDGINFLFERYKINPKFIGFSDDKLKNVKKFAEGLKHRGVPVYSIRNGIEDELVERFLGKDLSELNSMKNLASSEYKYVFNKGFICSLKLKAH